MKHTGVYLTILITFIIGVSVVLALYDKAGRMREAENGLRTAIENAVDNLNESRKDYSIYEPKEYVSDFMQQLVLQLDSDSQVTVSIVDTDYEKNMLSIEVTQSFSYLNGKKGTICCDKTVIMDEPLQEETAYHVVTFYVINNKGEEMVYKSYQVKNAEKVDVSYIKEPVQDGRTFDVWQDSSGRHLDTGIPITVMSDLVYYAKWQ